MASFLHSGDLGDAVYSLPSVRGLGGGEIYFASRPWTRTRWEDGKLLEALRPLIEASGYAEAYLHAGEYIDHDFSTFRNGGYRLGDTIVERQRRWVGASINLEPWLRAVQRRIARVVFSRAERWPGFHFPWAEVVRAFPEAVFLGLPHEHKAFEKEYGKVSYYPCRDLLEAAEVIQGSELFIGNQSACAAIAHGLGHAMVLEVCAYAPDCFLKRPNAYFSFNGEVEAKANGRKLSLEPFVGRFQTEVNGRRLSSDDREKLKVIARSVHAFDGTFAFYEEVPVYA